MFTDILLGVDGSPHSFRAAKTAAELARCMQASLRILVAYDPIPAYLGEPNLQHVISARLSEAEEILQQAKEIIGQIPGKLDAEILEGPAAEAILHVAEARKTDLIIMGSRGLGTLAGLLLGSQSNKVLQHAPCPVMVVR